MKFSFSQDQDLTKIAIVLPTQTAKSIFLAILPLASGSLVWFSGAMPAVNGHPPLQRPPAIEQSRSIL